MLICQMGNYNCKPRTVYKNGHESWEQVVICRPILFMRMLQTLKPTYSVLRADHFTFNITDGYCWEEILLMTVEP